MSKRFALNNCRWWGWGLKRNAKALKAKYAPFSRFIAKELGCSGKKCLKEPQAEELVIPPPILGESTLKKLGGVIEDGLFTTDTLERCSHALGKSYGDLLALREGRITNPPDAVIYPATIPELQRVINTANDMQIALVPYGGGTSLMGGVNGPVDHPFVTLDTRLLNQPLDIDKEGRCATFQSGIAGPDLESYLQEHGFTLGHYPHSFEYSTLGGWVATRSTGHYTNSGGRIEGLVRGLQMEVPGGTLKSATEPVLPSSPNLKELVIGSNGCLGIISQVTVAISQQPETKAWQSWYVPNFSEAIHILNEMVSRSLWPSTVQLSDPNSTKILLATQPRFAGGVFSWLSGAILATMTRSENSALVIVGFEGTLSVTESRLMHSKSLFKRYGSIELGTGMVQVWEANRFSIPYIRESLMDNGILYENIDFTTSWSNITTINRKVTTALIELLSTNCPHSFVTTEITNLYKNGVSMSLTIMTTQEAGHEAEQWQELRQTAWSLITENGGYLIQNDLTNKNASAIQRQRLGETGLRILRTVKDELDPHGIFNPGKLVFP